MQHGQALLGPVAVFLDTRLELVLRGPAARLDGGELVSSTALTRPEPLKSCGKLRALLAVLVGALAERSQLIVAVANETVHAPNSVGEGRARSVGFADVRAVLEPHAALGLAHWQ